MEVAQEFVKQFDDLRDYLALVVVDPRAYQTVNEDIVKFLVSQQRTPGVYITLNKPAQVLERKFQMDNIDTRLIIFIDCFSRTGDDQIKREKNILYIGSPERLSDISVAIEQAVNAIPSEKKFVLLDSLSTLLIYNKSGTVARFVHFLSNKMRSLKVKGVILSLEKEQEKDLLSDLSQFCDARIDMVGQ